MIRARGKEPTQKVLLPPQNRALAAIEYVVTLAPFLFNGASLEEGTQVQPFKVTSKASASTLDQLLEVTSKELAGTGPNF